MRLLAAVESEDGCLPERLDALDAEDEGAAVSVARACTPSGGSGSTPKRASSSTTTPSRARRMTDRLEGVRDVLATSVALTSSGRDASGRPLGGHLSVLLPDRPSLSSLRRR